MIRVLRFHVGKLDAASMALGALLSSLKYAV